MKNNVDLNMAHLTVRFSTFIESILRVPPLFVLDEIFKSGFTFPFNLWDSNDDSSLPANQAADGDSIDFSGVFYAAILFPLTKFVISLICKYCQQLHILPQ